jgi:hypothetical protein
VRRRPLIQDRRGPDDPDILAYAHRHASFFVICTPLAESLADGSVRT